MEHNDVCVDEEGYASGLYGDDDDDGDNFVVRPFLRCFPELE